MTNSIEVWVILRTSQYVRHLSVDKYFISEKAAKAYMNKLKVKQGAIAVPLDAA